MCDVQCWDTIFIKTHTHTYLYTLECNLGKTYYYTRLSAYIVCSTLRRYFYANIIRLYCKHNNIYNYTYMGMCTGVHGDGRASAHDEIRNELDVPVVERRRGGSSCARYLDSLAASPVVGGFLRRVCARAPAVSWPSPPSSRWYTRSVPVQLPYVDDDDDTRARASPGVHVSVVHPPRPSYIYDNIIII